MRQRLIRGFGANAVSNIVTVAIQLVSVPVFLRFWGTQLYGEWLVLSAIPYYLAMSDLGFGSVAATQMTIEVAQNDHRAALQTFQSVWTFITLISALLAGLTAAVVWILPLARWFHLSALSPSEAPLVILLWVIYLVVVLQSVLIAAGFRCNGAYATGVLYVNLSRVLEVAAGLAVVALGARPLAAVATYLAARTGVTVLSALAMLRRTPWLSFGIAAATFSKIRALAGAAIAFMAIPLGNALSIQGMVAAVGILLGPIAVVAYSVERTLSRVAFQTMAIVNNAVWPEMSAAFGANNIALGRRLHRAACQAVMWIMVPGLILLGIAGKWIIRVWTHSHVQFVPPLFFGLLVVVFVNGLWFTSAVVLIGSNRHQRMAALFVTTAVISFSLVLVLLPRIGLVAVPLCLLVSDLTLAPYVLRQSLSATQDGLSAFLRALATPPDLVSFLSKQKRDTLAIQNLQGTDG